MHPSGVSDRVLAFRRAVDGLIAVRDDRADRRSRLAERAEANAREQIVLAAAGNLLKGVVRANEERVKAVVEELVTRGLQAVYGPGIRFRVEVHETEKTADFRFVVDSGDGTDELPILESFGGGLKDVVAVLLRVAVLLMVRPLLRRLLVLDEAFKGLDPERQERAVAVLRELCAEFGLDVLFVTHSEAIADAADRLYRVRPLPEGMSVVEPVR